MTVASVLSQKQSSWWNLLLHPRILCAYQSGTSLVFMSEPSLPARSSLILWYVTQGVYSLMYMSRYMYTCMCTAAAMPCAMHRMWIVHVYTNKWADMQHRCTLHSSLKPDSHSVGLGRRMYCTSVRLVSSLALH